MTKTLTNILARPEIIRFIQDHINDDPSALVLSGGKYPELPIKEIAAQIRSRKKAQTKLPEWYAHDKIIFPHGVSMEQCSSEMTAKYKSTLIYGESVTDLTGGFGVDIFYLSRSFKQARYVEQLKELVALAEHNFEKLKARISLHNTSAEQYLAKEEHVAEWYYLDPARRNESDQKVFEIEDCTPDLNLIIPQLLERRSNILIKMSPLLDIQQALRALPNVEEVHVVSVRNECKEVLFKIKSGFEGSPLRVTANLQPNRKEFFEFTESDELELADFSMPLSYLYEPNASVMKAGGFNSIANSFGLKKLHRNSHLYTSERHVKDFPGRTFLIQDLTVVNKKKLKEFLSGNKANITVRNYPISVAQIRKKTGIKEGGGIYLFATTLMDQSLKMIVCKKVS